MTVTYGDRSFVRLLFHWKGSVWKNIWKKLILYLLIYFAINLSYRFAFTPAQKRLFEKIVNGLSTLLDRYPIQFVLGFYVNSVVTRWWDQLQNVAYPDKFLLHITAAIQVPSLPVRNMYKGSDATRREIRRTFARWANLVNVLVWKELSSKIRKRFPTNEHLKRAGLMTEHEYDVLMGTSPEHGRWFVPISWMVNLLARCVDEGYMDASTRARIVEVLYEFRSGTAMLTVYDWINLPLIYTQLVTIAVYGYFLFALFSRQSLEKDDQEEQADLVFPFFTVLEFVFYFGWLSVGEELRCPFGEDDDDFDMNYILDRNIYVSYMLVDELHDQKMPLAQDQWWNKKQVHLPHTRASYKCRDSVPAWRLSKMPLKLTKADMELLEEILAEAKGQTPRKGTSASISKKKPNTVAPTASLDVIAMAPPNIPPAPKSTSDEPMVRKPADSPAESAPPQPQDASAGVIVVDDAASDQTTAQTDADSTKLV